MTDQLKRETWVLAHDRDVDDYIERCLGRPWRLQQNDDMHSNDSMTWFEVYPDPEATAEVEAWLASPPARAPGRTGQPGFGEDVEIYTSTILNELCNRGLLDEGDLRVYISW